LEIIVKGGVPAWDKENKCFVDKASLEADKTETDNLDSELTMGVENVKASVVASTTTETADVPSTDDEGDDLPF
jgi:hypothetical protein